MEKTAIIYLLIACTLLFAYFSYHGILMRFRITLGTKIADAAVPYTQAPYAPTMHILFAGDSTAVGTGASTAETSLAGLAGKRYPTAHIDNIGSNGAKLADTITQLQGVTRSYDLIFLQVGGNDIVRWTSLDTVRSQYRELLTLATNRGMCVLHTSTGNVGAAPLFPTPLGWVYSMRTKRVIKIFQEELAALENDCVRYTYLYTSRKDDPFLRAVDTYYLPDYFHPSDAGYALWWKAMQTELDQLYK